MPVLVDTARTTALSLEPCSRPENAASSVLSNLLEAGRGPLLIYVKLYAGRHCNNIVIQAIAVAPAAKHGRTGSQLAPERPTRRAVRGRFTWIARHPQMAPRHILRA